LASIVPLFCIEYIAGIELFKALFYFEKKIAAGFEEHKYMLA
jgi:hypothetical protein